MSTTKTFTDAEVLELASKARSRLLFSQPFFGSLAMYLTFQLTDDPRIWIAATDGRHIILNRTTWPQLTDTQRMWIIAHEVMHPALGHVFAWRRGSRAQMPWNKAGDHAINLLLEQVPSLREGRLKDVLFDHKFDNMCAEEIYEAMLKEDPQCPCCGGTGEVQPSSGDQESGGEGDDGDGEKDGEKEGKGKSKNQKSGSGQGGKEPCPHCHGDFDGDIIEGNGSGEEEQQESREWAKRFVNTAKAAAQQGSLPAGIKRMLDDLTHPKLPWHLILSQMIGEIVRDDYSFDVFDRRYLHTGIYLPDIHNEKVYAAVGCDTSGSITQAMMKDFFSEVWGMLHARCVSKIRLMACDAEVHMDQVYYPSDPVPEGLPGGGGTDFRPMFKKLDEDTGDQPACLIVFTDLDGWFPAHAPTYPVIWVVPESQTRHGTKPENVPFGQVLIYNDA